MALNPTNTMPNGLLNPLPPSLKTQIPTLPPSVAPLGEPNPDQFQSSSPTGQASNTTSKTPALRFGGNPTTTHSSGPSTGRKVAAAGLGVLSGVGLAVAIPFGLLQMAVGIVLHPLLITGAITMALPFLGMLGSILLMSHKK